MIDTHQHLWNVEESDLPWLDGNERLNRNFQLAEYREATAELTIEQTVYMEVGMAAHEQSREAELVLAMCEDDATNMSGAVIAGDPSDAGFGDYIDRFRDRPGLKGLRHLLIGDSPRGRCLENDFQAGVRLLGEHELCFDICIPPTQLLDAVELIKACPQTRFVLDHCGNADPVAWAASHRRFRAPQHDADAWQNAIESLGELDNVVCKISGIIARVDPADWSAFDLRPIVEWCVESFGMDRVMFASDWPVCLMGAALRDWVAALDEITTEWSDTERDKLFKDNARQFYGLSE